MTRSRVPLALLGATSLLSLAACGEKKLDTGPLEKDMSKAVEKEVGRKVKSVECPESVTVEARKTFVCRVEISNGAVGRIVARQTDDEGHVAFRVTG